MQRVDGTLICLVRAKSNEDARRRLDKMFDSGDPKLLRHFQKLAAHHLQVIAGDKSQASLGLGQQTWQRLADAVDLIVDPAALVNAVLPYSELFGPNVVEPPSWSGSRSPPSSSPTPTCRLPTWVTKSSHRRSPRTPTSA